uniref:CUB domain-containing protein n=1 Tax=Strongyloides venezuelensis TaxID=75913 RepID=A0A0K0G1J6_STRVS
MTELRNCDTGVVNKSSSYSGRGHFGMISVSSPECRIQTTPTLVFDITYGIPLTSSGQIYLLSSHYDSDQIAEHCSEY